MIISPTPDPTPILGEEKYSFAVEQKRKHKIPRLKIHKHGLVLMVSPGISADDLSRYKSIAARLFLKCLKEGIPGTMFGRFDYEYDGITMSYKGKEFCRYFDRDAYERDNPIARPDQVSLIIKPTDDEVIGQAKAALNLGPMVTLQ